MIISFLQGVSSEQFAIKTLYTVLIITLINIIFSFTMKVIKCSF